MKDKHINISVAAVALMFALPSFGALAQELSSITFGEPGYGGSGCPDGTSKIVQSASEGVTTYAFDRYHVSGGGGGVDRQTCDIAIPVMVPDGVAVAVRSIGVRGAATLVKGHEATISVETFSAGTSGEIKEIPLSGPVDSEYDHFLETPEDQLKWSECGADINLRVNTGILVRGDQQDDLSLKTLIIDPLATRVC